MKTLGLLLIPTLSFLMEVNVMKCCFEETSDKNLKQTELNYQINGSGDTTLLFIHGWCIKSDYWDNQMRNFKDKYKVVAFDLPGFHFNSPSQEWTIEAYSRDVLELIDELRLKNVILIGHSMGGDVMLEAALRNRKEIVGLIGIDNFKMVGMEMTKEQEVQIAGFLKMLKADFSGTSIQYIDQYLFSPNTDPEVKKRVKSDIGAANPHAGIASMEDLISYDKIRAERLKKLNLKLYLINSDGFPTHTEGLEKYCGKGYEILDIHATGHYPMIEKPDEFNELLEQAIAMIAKGE